LGDIVEKLLLAFVIVIGIVYCISLFILPIKVNSFNIIMWAGMITTSLALAGAYYRRYKIKQSS